jgi:predicted metal-dependent hydrolase
LEKTIQTELGPLTVTITRKRMKNLYLRVLPPNGKLQITAPNRVSDLEIEHFVLSRLDWIARQREKVTNRKTTHFADGEPLPYFGKMLTLRLIFVTGRTKTERYGETLALSIRADADEQARKHAVDAWYRRELASAAETMLPACERTVGKRAGELKIRDMKTRWGTCNIKTGEVTINLRLAEKPPECLRYVLTHELCHLHEPGHGERFWKRMDVYYPDWKRIRKLLKTT